MSSAPAHGPILSEKDPLSSLAQRLPDPQDREWYGKLVSYIHSLEPTDELVKIAQLFGFLTLMGQELPAAIGKEQNSLREMLLKAHEALQKLVATNAGYHEALKQRLSKLPDEIAAGVKPEVIAKAISESFRQQLVATGIQEAQVFLAQSTRDLKRVTAELDKAVQPLVGRYGTLADQMDHKAAVLTTAAGRLQDAAIAVDRQNSELLTELRQWDWWVLPCAALVLLLVGAWAGYSWEQHQVTNAS